jgi:predicted DsbA family dithiol-disulfide isomerase
MHRKTLCSKRYTQITALKPREHDVTGVPTFVINNEYTIVSAQNEQTFIELFEKIEKETMHCPNDETASYVKKDAKKR